ncbi:MAG: hypothetical protein ABR915_04410 [Thermoguttaceae bacterium]
MLAAILPFTLGKKAEQGPTIGELPGFRANAASPAIATTTTPGPNESGAGAGATLSGTIQETSQASIGNTPAYLTPQPQVGTSRPKAPGDLGWPPPVAPGAATNPKDPPQGHPADYRVSDPAEIRPAEIRPAEIRPAEIRPGEKTPGQPPDYQADLRGSPTRDYRMNRSEAFRDESPNRYPGAGAAQGNPLMPSPAPGVSAASAQDPPQSTEPGVARLEGTIESPPVRTNYDRTGPSDH